MDGVPLDAEIILSLSLQPSQENYKAAQEEGC